MIEDDNIGNESLLKERNTNILNLFCKKENNDQNGNISESFIEDCATNIIIQASFQDSSRSHEQDIITQQSYIFLVLQR